MKKFYLTGLAILAFATTWAQAQISTHKPIRMYNYTHPKFNHPQATGRAGSVQVFLDYGILDSLAAALAINGPVGYHSTLIGTNTHETRQYQEKVVGMAFKHYYDLDSISGYPFYEHAVDANTQVRLDSFFYGYAHDRVAHTGGNDTITIKVKAIPNAGAFAFGDTGYVAPVVYSETIITDTALTGPGTQANTYRVKFGIAHPNLVLPAGTYPAIQIDFAGDTAHNFFLLADYQENCEDSCTAASSKVPNTTVTLAGVNGMQGFNGVTLVGTVGYGCSNVCNDLLEQSLEIYPFITLTYAKAVVSAATDQQVTLKICNGDAVQLNAFTSGASGAVTYKWSPATGLSDATIANPIATISGTTNVTYTVTAYDGADSSTATATVVSRGITATLPASVNLNCGASVNLTPTVTTSATGTKTYMWSTGATSATLSGVNAAGTYNFTVTNSLGCSATATTNVSIPGVSANAVNFGLPNNSPNLCKDNGYLFPNTSARTSGWNATWTFTSAQDVYTGMDGYYRFTTVGSGVPVKLTMDSAGCAFSTQKTVNIKTTGCVAAVETVAFEKAISVLPNPTSGNISIVVPNTEEKVSVRIYNILGSEVKSLTEEANGTFNKNMNISDLSNGTYIVKIQSGNNVATRKLTLNK
ncbi:MAG: T9SS type A sorting domain-containing protein [Chitinophagales bacterium]